MFENFEVRDVDTGGARIHFAHGGEGPPLLLLHGNPLSHVSWHKIAPRLAENFHVVAPDLRGYGDSSAPEPEPDDANYSFGAMALDQVEVMAELGYTEFVVAGHDRGGRTAHRMGLDHPDKVKKVAIIDILPSHHVWSNADANWAKKSWHWLFMIQPCAEEMMNAVPARWFMEQKLSKPEIGLGFFDPAAFDEYVRCFNEKTVRGSCADYRACAGIDFQRDNADFEAGNKLTMPMLSIWGARSHTGTVWGDLVPIWQRYADDVTGGPIDCGHYVPEEAPDATYDWLARFFVD
ncbi:MAG: alpha/beta hydrolase [Rhodospirillaceae bacterium]